MISELPSQAWTPKSCFDVLAEASPVLLLFGPQSLMETYQGKFNHSTLSYKILSGVWTWHSRLSSLGVFT